MSEPEHVIGQMTKRDELSREWVRLMQNGKKFNHPVTAEIMLLCIAKDQLDSEEFKEKYVDLQKKLHQLLKDIPSGDKYMHIDAIRAMSILAQDAGEYDQAQIYLETVNYFLIHILMVIKFKLWLFFSR